MKGKFIILFFLIGCMACIRPKIVRTPQAGDYFQALLIRFNFSDGSGKQSGKIHWRSDERSAKFLFFTPLNQVGLELDVAGEIALLLRPEKKLFWRGDFSFLLERLWGIQLNLRELKRLILAGTIPEEKTIGKNIAVDLETDPADRSPQVIHIRQGLSVLTLRVVSSETRPGRVILLDHVRRFQAAELEDVLRDD